ncbi:hypothetical protein OCGS_1461 [Oceaniovalibus guishaninsula JLT2003]|uniref:Uncharacterized protein n=1 Tax=Oceaniovalibus guishaninsula JLT2003 TaxID=1231392 RepID=K2HAV1_9RHOB|nr:hypothetical protein [Oceaniovalibus guishaninsula]EKE44623.1 hypothetical protein OCGS_1461 [Oceaniovalibus guishaninsula JLT2003]
MKTITIGSCVSVQGQEVGQLADGRILVRVGTETFAGRPIRMATGLR